VKQYSTLLLVLSLLSATVLISCGGGDAGSATSPFIGGTLGLDIKFQEAAPPREVFDGGDFPFDIVLILENVGERPVQRKDVEVSITGFRPEEFSSTPGEMKKSPTEDLIAKRKNPEGQIIPGNPVFVEFTGFNHQGKIVGAAQQFPIQAGVCYKYGTIANTQLCSRKDVLSALDTGVCKVNEDKTVFNSGAPVQVSTITQNARGKDRIGFTFKIVHSGTGKIYEAKGGERCDASIRKDVNKVHVKVDTGLAGLSCTGLGEGGTEGLVTLYNGEKIVTCTQQLEGRDFKFQLLIDLEYDYEEFIETTLNVKASGG